MKITHHKNGQFSLTELTRYDLNRLALALGHAELEYRKSTGWDGAEALGAQLAQEAVRLERWLRIASNWAGDSEHLPAGRSLTLKSADWQSDPAYAPQDVSQVRPGELLNVLAGEELDKLSDGF